MKSYPYPKFTGGQLQELLYELSHQLSDAEEAYNDARETFVLLDGFKKEKFAGFMKHDRNCSSSIEGRKQNVYTDAQWIEYKQGMMDAQIKMERLEMERDKLNRYWETARSLLSSENNIRRTNT